MKHESHVLQASHATLLQVAMQHIQSGPSGLLILPYSTMPPTFDQAMWSTPGLLRILIIPEQHIS